MSRTRSFQASDELRTLAPETRAAALLIAKIVDALEAS